jgi:hypothetical protein
VTPDKPTHPGKYKVRALVAYKHPFDFHGEVFASPDGLRLRTEFGSPESAGKLIAEISSPWLWEAL